jgi:release factor glutamine methyltransferase
VKQNDAAAPDSMGLAVDIAGLRRQARALLGGEDAAMEADLLIAHAIDRPRAWLLAHGEFQPDAADRAEIVRLLRRRSEGVPIAYLTGSRGFWNFDLAVDASTLIPRPETELLVELALARLPVDAAARVADLGTGSGAIAIALGSERPRLQLLATDASPAALEVALANASRLGARAIEFRLGDWGAALAVDERFDMILSNPPYLGEDDVHLQQGDLRFEPRSALASGVDGLDAIRCIGAAAPRHLEPGGWLLIEHGQSQGAAVREILRSAGLVDVETVRDLESRDRVTLGRMPPAAASSPGPGPGPVSVG